MISQKSKHLPGLLQPLRTVPLHVADFGEHGAELFLEQERLRFDVRQHHLCHVQSDCRRLLLRTSAVRIREIALGREKVDFFISKTEREIFAGKHFLAVDLSTGLVQSGSGGAEEPTTDVHAIAGNDFHQGRTFVSA